jgi:hypothetical protein
VFADMFVGWAYGEWDRTTTYGTEKEGYMNGAMTNFLSTYFDN